MVRGERGWGVVLKDAMLFTAFSPPQPPQPPSRLAGEAEEASVNGVVSTPFSHRHVWKTHLKNLLQANYGMLRMAGFRGLGVYGLRWQAAHCQGRQQSGRVTACSWRHIMGLALLSDSVGLVRR